MLEDGRYDAIVFDADDSGDGVVVVELTILSGPRKGEVVAVRTTALRGDPVDLLGIPATITVAAGEPSVTFEP